MQLFLCCTPLDAILQQSAATRRKQLSQAQFNDTELKSTGQAERFPLIGAVLIGCEAAPRHSDGSSLRPPRLTQIRSSTS
jgi:hypothetical protein